VPPPETLVRLEAGVLHTFSPSWYPAPGQNEEEDKRLEAELLADPKGASRTRYAS